MNRNINQTVIWRRTALVFVIVAIGLLIFAAGIAILAFGRDGESDPDEKQALEASSRESAPKPAQNDPAPQESAPKPAQNTPAPQESAPKPAQNDPSPQESAPGPAQAEQLSWSDWSDSLPDGVTSDRYSIETRTLYSSRTLETMRSAESSVSGGWELYNTAEEFGEYGAWSDWSQTKPAQTEGRETEVRDRYRYRDRETTEGFSPSLAGWDLTGTTEQWGDYGPWSDWTQTPPDASDVTEVQETVLYRHRDRETAASDDAGLEGWTQYDVSTSWGEYGDWSDWSASSMNESEFRQVQTKTQYKYGIYVSDLSYEDGSTFFAVYPYEPARSHVHYATYWLDERLPAVWDSRYECYAYGPYGSYEEFEYWYDEQSRELFRYRDRSLIYTYYYYRWGDWSDWSEAKAAESDVCEVESAVFYRSRDRQKVSVYHFSRWGEWSAWSETAQTASDSRETEKAAFYRCRDRQKKTLYEYRRWTDWTAFSTVPVEKTDSVQVQTKLQYRYLAPARG